MTKRIVGTALILGLALALSAQAQDKPESLLLGEFELAEKDAVIDGDTIRVTGLKSSLRLLCLDAEETFKNASDRKAAVSDFEAYREAKEAVSDMPVKYATFVGEEGRDFAVKFFDGIKKVRLEYDTLNRKVDYYGRNLCYIFATPKGAGEEKNYNVELVRAGLSPYSMKYGHSRRFREKFEAAEKEARDAKRGIWAEKPRGYRDYDQRLKWWSERADQADRFEQKHRDDKSAIILGDDDTGEKLKAAVGKEVTLLGGVLEANGLFPDEKQPRVMLGHREKQDVAVRFGDKKAYGQAKPDSCRGYFVVVKGVLQFDEKAGYSLTVSDAKDFTKA